MAIIIHSLSQWEPVERHPSVMFPGLQPPLHLPQKCLLLGYFSTDYVSCFVFFLLCETNDLIHILFVLWVYTFLLLYYSCFSVDKCVWLFATPRIAAQKASLSFTISPSLLKLMSIESVIPSNHLILCHPLLLLPSIFLSTRVFSSVLALHIRWLGIGASVSASVLSMNIQHWFPLGFTGLISSQSKRLSRVFSSNHNSKPLILWCSAFCTVRLSHPYMTTEETIALTIQTFVGKVMLCFLMCYLGLS